MLVLGLAAVPAGLGELLPALPGAVWGLVEPHLAHAKAGRIGVQLPALVGGLLAATTQAAGLLVGGGAGAPHGAGHAGLARIGARGSEGAGHGRQRDLLSLGGPVRAVVAVVWARAQLGSLRAGGGPRLGRPMGALAEGVRCLGPTAAAGIRGCLATTAPSNTVWPQAVSSYVGRLLLLLAEAAIGQPLLGGLVQQPVDLAVVATIVLG